MKQTLKLILVFLFSVSAQATPQKFFSDLERFQTQSLTLKTEKESLESDQTTLLRRKLFWTPRLSLSAGKSRTELNDVTTYEQDSVGADLSLNVFRGGAELANMKSAEANEKAQNFKIQNEVLKLEISASDLIFKQLYLMEALRIQNESFKLKQESLKIVGDRFRQGKTPLQEVTKAEVDLTQAKGRLNLAGLDILENKTSIRSQFVSQIETADWPFNERSTANIKTDKKSPEIQQKYWLSESYEQLWKSAGRGHYPSLDVSLQYLKFPLKDQANTQATSLVTLTLPIWSQYETEAAKASAFAQYVGAENDLKASEKSLESKLLFLKEKVEVARNNLVDAKNNLEKSRRLYQDVLRSFKLGRLSTNDLFIEQGRLFDSESTLAASQLSFHQTLIESCALNGLRASDCLR